VGYTSLSEKNKMLNFLKKLFVAEKPTPSKEESEIVVKFPVEKFPAGAPEYVEDNGNIYRINFSLPMTFPSGSFHVAHYNYIGKDVQ
jgi:hypothetical protein